jgi:hypothetical protein
MRLLPALLALACLFCALPLTPALAQGQGGPLVPPMRGFGSFQTLFHVPRPPPPMPPALAPGSTTAASATPAPPAPPGAQAPGMLCRAAILAAERAHGIPQGMLLAIGLVESGRTDPATGQRNPWPWAVNAEGRGALLDTREAALAFVRQSEAAGIRSVDIGCMQVNRVHHPNAFASLEHGFDPMTNADYAARFLKQLKEGPAGGDWNKAVGFYHSQTPERAEPYRNRVQAALAGLPPGATAPIPIRPPVPAAAPGGGGQMLSNGAEQVAMMPAANGMMGRGLAAYRSNPVPLAMVVTGLRRGVSAVP